jgi:hypothetical protein
MNQPTSEELFNMVKARQEADQDLIESQDVCLELADKACIESVIEHQFSQVRRVGAGLKVLQRKADKLSKQIREQSRSKARAMKRLEREAYGWASLGWMPNVSD